MLEMIIIFNMNKFSITKIKKFLKIILILLTSSEKCLVLNLLSSFGKFAKMFGELNRKLQIYFSLSHKLS